MRILFLLVALTAVAAPTLPQGAIEESALETLPGKKPLIKRTYRPPNYESPVEYFDQVFTPNDKFFVRYHLSDIPKLNLKIWRLTVGGEAAGKPVTFTAAQLKHDFKQVEVAALAFCSGNRRGLFNPHVPGVQWANGAMGNARWKGVRLRDVLERAGIKKEALEVVFDGADGPVNDKTPDFKKSIPLAKALDDNTIIAFEMNGKPLHQSQGFPARIVVPGWTATYWVKHVVSIEIVSKSFDGFWMKTAYRIPKGKFPAVEGHWPGQETDTSVPITEIAVSSLITNIREDQHLRSGHAFQIKGLAWDGGHGISKVEFSSDGGKTWQLATLGLDYGKYSWRQFTSRFTPAQPGSFTIMTRATNSVGATQGNELVANPAGYHNNVIHSLIVTAD
ncbi:MAG: molybdopterin-dependent oxidoreductase [Deltaproteobacteria bacterium]|nr:molybdopterin-dependent oxidoreductase [Deltaproteobacteria bacterium]